MEKAPEPFIKEVLTARDREEGAYAEVEHEEGVPELFPEAEEDSELQPEAESVDDDLPSTPTLVRADAYKSPPLGASHTLTVSVALGSTS